MMEIKNKNLVERTDSGTYSPIEKEPDSFDKVGFIPFRSITFQVCDILSFAFVFNLHDPFFEWSSLSNQLHFKYVILDLLCSFLICTTFFMSKLVADFLISPVSLLHLKFVSWFWFIDTQECQNFNFPISWLHFLEDVSVFVMQNSICS